MTAPGSPETPGQVIATVMAAIRSQSVGRVCYTEHTKTGRQSPTHGFEAGTAYGVLSFGASTMLACPRRAFGLSGSTSRGGGTGRQLAGLAQASQAFAPERVSHGCGATP